MSYKDVVIKVAQGVTSKSQKKSAIRELINLRLLRDSPGIVKLIDIDEAEYLDKKSHTLYMIMEQMDEDLALFMRKTDSLSKYQVKLFMWQILEAIRDMHAKQIFHRDLKLENILIKDEKIVKICDFGLSKCMHGQMNVVESLKLLQLYEEEENQVNVSEIFKDTAFNESKKA